MTLVVTFFFLLLYIFLYVYFNFMVAVQLLVFLQACVVDVLFLSLLFVSVLCQVIVPLVLPA